MLRANSNMSEMRCERQATIKMEKTARMKNSSNGVWSWRQYRLLPTCTTSRFNPRRSHRLTSYRSSPIDNSLPLPVFLQDAVSLTRVMMGVIGRRPKRSGTSTFPSGNQSWPCESRQSASWTWVHVSRFQPRSSNTNFWSIVIQVATRCQPRTEKRW